MGSQPKTGMCVPFSVRVTPDKGRGVFAESAISKGSTVWRHVDGQYSAFDESSLNALLTHLPDDEAVYVLEHIHCMPEFPEYMVWVFDEGELINHADHPTLRTHTKPDYQDLAPTSTDEVHHALRGDYFTLVAARDIAPGEELTLDYNEDPDDPPYFSALWEQYGLRWDWL